MRIAFTQGDGIVVAVLTSVSGLIVGKRHNHRPPLAGIMAVFAGVTGNSMVCCFIRLGMTTAGNAVADNRFFMGKRQNQWRPGCDRMACLAICRCIRMRCTLAGYAISEPVVTACSGARLPRHRTMVKGDLQPVGHTGMTGIAGVRGDHMIRPLARRNRIIMASSARFSCLVMSERLYKTVPTRTSSVTQLTSVCGFGMSTGLVTGVSAFVTRCASIGSLLMRKWRNQR